MKEHKEHNDLFQEFAAAVGGLDDRGLAYLGNVLGIPQNTIYGGASLIGRQYVQFTGYGFYQPNPDGVPALIIAEGERGEHNIGWESIAELVAFHSPNPDTWAVRAGSVPLLGHDNVRRASFFGEPLVVHRNPLKRLQGGAKGVVVLHWARHLPLWLGGISHLICDDAVIAKRLEAVFHKVRRSVPEIRVINTESQINVAA
jgi:hypothetical protein